MTAAKRFNRPKARIEENSSAEASISAIIHKGGSVAKREGGEEIRRVQLRLPLYAQTRIDEVRKNRAVKPSRHSWILEAIYEKLEREEP